MVPSSMAAAVETVATTSEFQIVTTSPSRKRTA
jgi:hypothetical protein